VDVVHVHGLSDAFYGALLFCRLRSVPLVFEMTLMGADDPSTALGTRQLLAGLRRRAYRSCDAYVAMSEAFLPSFAAAGLPHTRLRVIAQGVDTRRFRRLSETERTAVRAEVGLAPSDPVVVFVGSLIERKGIDVLLSAWACVHAERPDARLVLVGKDRFPPHSPEDRFLASQFAQLPRSAAASIHSLGLRDDPERWMGAADAFVFPSRREGFGTVTIEAMACELPCVVTPLDGITDLVFAAPGCGPSGPVLPGDGIVVPQDDVPALAAALLGLLASPDRGRTIGAAARSRVENAFDIDRVIAPAYEELYRSLLPPGGTG
jgi:glycosyltransferase involved in cell wall biosynthesis